MILFTEENKPKILDGSKTQTRRLWKRCRAKVGAIHLAYTRPPFARPPGKPFARLEIVAVREEPLCAISDEDAVREGYSDRASYLRAFDEINGPTDRTATVWVVDFKLAGREHGELEEAA